MNNITIQYMDFPSTIRAFTVRHFDGDVFYTVVLNAHLSAEMQKESYEHELEHIQNGDFTSDIPLDYLECMRH